MEQILEGIRRVINRWVNTAIPLVVDSNVGDTVIYVANTKRFTRGETCIIQESSTAETKLIIDEILDNTSIRLSAPLVFAHKVGDNALLVKTINNQIVQAIHIGDPAVIPLFPAICVNGVNKTSQEWLTLESTKEVYNIEINIYIQDSTQEEGYRFLLRMAKIIETGLKKNIFPLLNDYVSVAVLADVAGGDVVVRVDDTSNLLEDFNVVIEDDFRQSWSRIKRIIDANHIELKVGFTCPFSVIDNPVLIMPRRQLFNSWPDSVDFGFVHKGTLLKAAKISWFAWEEQIHAPSVQQDTYLT